MTFTNKLNYNVNGNLISDEVITLSGGNKDYVLLHHNLMTSPTQIEIWTGTNQTGTQITDFSTTKDGNKSWVYNVTFGTTVTDGTYYATYYSQGDENDADDINNIYGVMHQENLILDYTFNGNTVFTPTALDITTGQITVSETIGTTSLSSINAFYNTNLTTMPASTDLPKELAGSSNTSGTKVTDNILTIGGRTTYTNTGDLTKWHLEVAVSQMINNIFEPNKNYKIELQYTLPAYNLYLSSLCVNSYNWNNVKMIWGSPVRGDSYGYGLGLLNSSPTGLRGTMIMNLTNGSNDFTLTAQGYGAGYTGTTLSSWTSYNAIEYSGSPMVNFGLNCGRNPIGNGTNVKIYEVTN